MAVLDTVILFEACRGKCQGDARVEPAHDTVKAKTASTSRRLLPSGAPASLRGGRSPHGVAGGASGLFNNTNEPGRIFIHATEQAVKRTDDGGPCGGRLHGGERRRDHADFELDTAAFHEQGVLPRMDRRHREGDERPRYWQSGIRPGAAAGPTRSRHRRGSGRGVDLPRLQSGALRHHQADRVARLYRRCRSGIGCRLAGL